MVSEGHSTGSPKHRTSGSDTFEVVGGTHHLLPRGSMEKLLPANTFPTRPKTSSRGLRTQQGTHQRGKRAQRPFHQDREEDEA
jgi:hypothetical protein